MQVLLFQRLLTYACFLDHPFGQYSVSTIYLPLPLLLYTDFCPPARPRHQQTPHVRSLVRRSRLVAADSTLNSFTSFAGFFELPCLLPLSSIICHLLLSLSPGPSAPVPHPQPLHLDPCTVPASGIAPPPAPPPASTRCLYHYCRRINR